MQLVPEQEAGCHTAFTLHVFLQFAVQFPPQLDEPPPSPPLLSSSSLSQLDKAEAGNNTNPKIGSVPCMAFLKNSRRVCKSFSIVLQYQDYYRVDLLPPVHPLIQVEAQPCPHPLQAPLQVPEQVLTQPLLHPIGDFSTALSTAGLLANNTVPKIGSAVLAAFLKKSRLD